MDAFLLDVRYALRQMWRAPAFTITVVLVLALGIGANSAAVSFLRGINSIPAPGVASDEDLVRVFVTASMRRGRPQPREISFASFVRLRDSVHGFSGIAAERAEPMSVDFGGGPRSTRVNGVTADYFGVLQLTPLRGSFISTADDANAVPDPVAVVSERVWASQFGRDPDIAGRRIRINDVPFTVVGVAPKDFGGLHRDFHTKPAGVWIAMGSLRRAKASGTNSSAAAYGDSLSVNMLIGRLTPDATIASARASMSAATLRVMRISDTTVRSMHTSVDRLRIGENAWGRDGDLVLAGFSITAFAIVILLMACTNVSALLLGRSSARRREIGVRLSLGADRRRIVRQLLTESMLLALLACIAGLASIMVLRQVVLAMTIESGLLLFPLDWQTVALALAAAGITGMLFGLSPALHASRASLSDMVAGGSVITDWRRTRAQRAMIVGQLALSQPLLLATMLALGLVGSQRPWESNVNDPSRVVGVTVDFGVRRYTPVDAFAMSRTIRARLGELAQVERVEFADRVDGVFEESSGTFMNELVPEQSAGQAEWSSGWRGSAVEISYVTPAFFEATGISIVLGRAFEPADTLTSGRAQNIILPADVAARYWPGENPIGKRLVPDVSAMPRIGRETGSAYTVVGIARAQRSVLPAERPLMYVPASVRGFPRATLIVRTRTPGEAVLPLLRREIARLDPQLPILQLETWETASKANLATAGRMSVIASSLALFTLALASLGLGGIVMYSVSQRTREIGVRMALGAQKVQITKLFVGQGMRTALLGFAIGAPLSALIFLAVVKFYFVPQLAVNIMSAAIAVGVLFAVVMAAAWIPARKAARVDPVIALRSE